MTPERWKEVEKLYQAAAELAAPERSSFLTQACADAELRREVESLLLQRIADNVLDRDLSNIAANLVGNDSSELIGRTIAHYQVHSLIGRGGMGEVYRAHDLKLRRDVAVKVMPQSFILDADRLARFTSEAHVLASLSHPNIGAIYGLEQGEGRHALVLELIEGPTLAERIARQPIPLEEALSISRQIAQALEAAHEQGIIHRDLKPANIKVTEKGTVKVLDFGLAKTRAASGTVSELSNSPTMAPTIPGMILGTAQYMSPEQASGKEADRSSDVWAFGCVLYEMLTGQCAFPGETVGEIIAVILKSEPDWSRLPASTPESIRRLLRRSLQKDQALRLRDFHDVQLEVADSRVNTADRFETAKSDSRRGERIAWVSVLALVTIAAVVFGVLASRPRAAAAEVRLEINTPPARSRSIALSPDGRSIVFNAPFEGQVHLWLSSLDSTSARPRPGTAGGGAPSWSPNSRSIVFNADSKLKRFDLDKGVATTILKVAGLPQGLTWNTDDVILFSKTPGVPLLRIPAAGGEPMPVTRLESTHRSHVFPQFLPDGRHFVFFVGGNAEARGVYVGQLDKPDAKRLFDADSAAVYSATGHLLFVRQQTLFAQAFDADRLEVTGEPFPIAQGVNGGTYLSASQAGPIAYRTPSPDSNLRQLVWVDRTGKELERVTYPDSAALGPGLSMDGRHVGVFRLVNENMDIWSYDRVRHLWDRITVSPRDDLYPLWSPDGLRIVFAEDEGAGGAINLHSKLLSAPTGEGESTLLSTAEPKFPMDWSRDGRFLLYGILTSQTGIDLWVLPMEGDKTPREVIKTEFNEQLAQFSPDGKWIAYQSDKTGRNEIYLRRFPGSGSDTPVTADGGTQVRWNPNGKELFYIAPDDRMMAVPIQSLRNGEELEPGTPVPLFLTNIGSTAVNVFRQQYVVLPDGQSFMLNSTVGDSLSSPITVILNWVPKPSR